MFLDSDGRSTEMEQRLHCLADCSTLYDTNNVNDVIMHGVCFLFTIPSSVSMLFSITISFAFYS